MFARAPTIIIGVTTEGLCCNMAMQRDPVFHQVSLVGNCSVFRGSMVVLNNAVSRDGRAASFWRRSESAFVRFMMADEVVMRAKRRRS